MSRLAASSTCWSSPTIGIGRGGEPGNESGSGGARGRWVPPLPSPVSATPPSASLSVFELPLVPDDNVKSGDLDVDEGFCDDPESIAWMENLIAGRSLRYASAQASGGIRKPSRYPGLAYRSSHEAGLQCTNVVRNVPRMRRRKGEKHKSRSSKSRAGSTASSTAMPPVEGLRTPQSEPDASVQQPSAPGTCSGPQARPETQPHLEAAHLMDIEPDLNRRHEPLRSIPEASPLPPQPLPQPSLQPAMELAWQPLVEDHGMQ